MIKPVPVIFDTDIGSDIDDTWALAMILKSPEIDLKMITTNGYETAYQTALSAKMMTVCNRTDVIVAQGAPGMADPRYQEEWIGDFDVESYPNLSRDAAKSMVDFIMKSDEEVVILVAGSSKNIADAYRLDPRIAKKCRLVAIGGVIYNGHCKGWYPPLGADWNVKCDRDSWQYAMVETDYKVELLPLDVTGNLKLEGDVYAKIRECADTDPVIKMLIENTDLWMTKFEMDYHMGTSALFDTVGVYACFTHENLEFETLPIYANEAAQTLIDPERGKDMYTALRWGDKEKFKKFLAARLCSEI